MARPRACSFVSLCCFLLLAAGVIQAGDLDRPTRFVPRIDSQLVRVTSPTDGTTWAAWTYRNGSETDIALAIRDGDGRWSEPHRIGLDDGRSQHQPALALDEYGTLYLGYAERSTGRVLVTAKGRDALDWTTPAVVSAAGERASSPALIIAANRRLVVGYLEGRTSVKLLELRLLPPQINGSGNDGPDPVGWSYWPDLSSSKDEGQDRVIDDNMESRDDVIFTGPRHRGDGSE